MSFENALSAVWPLLLSTGLIALNEMGDKSQILAMAFAARMKLRKVLLGIFFAVVVLNALAVAVGSLLASVPGWQRWVQLASAILFLIFGLWSLKSEDSDNNDCAETKNKKHSYGDIAIVFTSFFFSEMGDKTQLVTISLAARYPSVPLLILAGTTLGMLIADGIGIFAGVIVHKRLPENALRLSSAALFIFFGIVGLWQSLHNTFLLSTGVTLSVIAAAAISTITGGYFIYRKRLKK